jgi:hypothetical protein
MPHPTLCCWETLWCGEQEEKRSNASAHEIEFFSFFPFGKMLIVILSRRVHLLCAVARSFPHITADSENSRDIQ